jgi:hypothetical protein
MRVRVLKSWNDLDFLRQTPGGRGAWRGIQFVLDEPGPVDYVVIHNRLDTPQIVTCAPENVWLMVGEPPNEYLKALHSAPPWIARIYTNDATLNSPQHRLSYPGLPWHVEKDYDYLVSCPVPEKTKPLSWITSSQTWTAGHRARMETVNKLQSMPELDLFGRGFTPLTDKWDGLAPYRYSIAYENFSNSHYWTEKVMDCFLAWTMPIYYGCTQLEKFFPAESFVQLDPQADSLEEKVREVIQSNLREKNLEAIVEARRRVLHDYNFFEFIARETEAHKQPTSALKRCKRPILLHDHTLSHSQFFARRLKDIGRQWKRPKGPKP